MSSICVVVSLVVMPTLYQQYATLSTLVVNFLGFLFPQVYPQAVTLVTDTTSNEQMFVIGGQAELSLYAMSDGGGKRQGNGALSAMYSALSACDGQIFLMPASKIAK